MARAVDAEPLGRGEREKKRGRGGGGRDENDCCDEPEKTCIVPELTVRYTLSCCCFLLAREGLKRGGGSIFELSTREISIVTLVAGWTSKG